ncbi:hypothetical protein QY96_00189 [Bacillus thermotolerans]|nr:hypothetical protein QY96_00189 [Bacillus thermotolerans]
MRGPSPKCQSLTCGWHETEKLLSEAKQPSENSFRFIKS